MALASQNRPGGASQANPRIAVQHLQDAMRHLHRWPRRRPRRCPGPAIATRVADRCRRHRIIQSNSSSATSWISAASATAAPRRWAAGPTGPLPRERRRASRIVKSSSRAAVTGHVTATTRAHAATGTSHGRSRCHRDGGHRCQAASHRRQPRHDQVEVVAAGGPPHQEPAIPVPPRPAPPARGARPTAPRPAPIATPAADSHVTRCRGPSSGGQRQRCDQAGGDDGEASCAKRKRRRLVAMGRLMACTGRGRQAGEPRRRSRDGPNISVFRQLGVAVQHRDDASSLASPPAPGRFLGPGTRASLASSG